MTSDRLDLDQMSVTDLRAIQDGPAGKKFRNRQYFDLSRTHTS
jgi:hypothetical protein